MGSNYPHQSYRSLPPISIIRHHSTLSTSKAAFISSLLRLAFSTIIQTAPPHLLHPPHQILLTISATLFPS